MSPEKASPEKVPPEKVPPEKISPERTSQSHSSTRVLGDLQLAIMRVLWSRGEAAAAEVHTALEEERGLAPTTIATMLRKMEDKGVVAHRAEGRRFLYRPTVSEPEVKRTMVGELTSRLFRGNPAALVSHLIAEHEIDPDELAELKRRLAEIEEA